MSYYQKGSVGGVVGRVKKIAGRKGYDKYTVEAEPVFTEVPAERPQLFVQDRGAGFDFNAVLVIIIVAVAGVALFSVYSQSRLAASVAESSITPLLAFSGLECGTDNKCLSSSFSGCMSSPVMVRECTEKWARTPQIAADCVGYVDAVNATVVFVRNSNPVLLLFDSCGQVQLPGGGSGPGGGIAGVRLTGVGDALVAADAKLVNCLNAVNSYERSNS